MILYTLKKKNAKHQIIFEEDLKMDPIDKYYIDVKYKKKNSTTVEHTIVRRDLDNWIDYYQRNGWVIIENDEK